jgi:polygalacturonase
MAIGLACLGVLAGRASGVVNVLDHGAVGDGTTLNTEALQKAVAACVEHKGGTILVPPGVYRTGPIQLQSNVTLQLEAGAILRASERMEDHRVGGRGRPLIWARDANHVTICGQGIIDNRGTAFMRLNQVRTNPGDFEPRFTRQGERFMDPNLGSADGPVTFGPRPNRLIAFYNCRDVRLRDVTLTDASIWTVHLADCNRVVVSGVTILNNPLVPNSDGVHCTTCRNVRISDCEMVCGDDAICITSVESRPGGLCENVAVSNCTLSSRSAGVRVGYGPNPIRNCVFENLVIRNSNRGLGLFVRQEGSIENVQFSNIVIQTRLHTGHWWGKGEPIHLSVLPDQKTQTSLGRIRNVAFTNILAESESGVVIWSQEPGQIEDVTFNQVRLRVRKSPLSESYGGNIDLRPAFDPQWAIFRHDLAGIFCHRAAGLTLNQVEVRWDAEMPDYYDHALWCEQTDGVVIDGFRGRQSGPGADRSALFLDSVRNVTIRNAQAAEGTTTFLRHRNLTEAGLFGDNDLTRAATAIDPLPSPFAPAGPR